MTETKQNYAKLVTSSRLRVMLKFIKEIKKPVTALEIMKGTDFVVQAVGSAASELRANATIEGYDSYIACFKKEGKHYYLYIKNWKLYEAEKRKTGQEPLTATAKECGCSISWTCHQHAKEYALKDRRQIGLDF